MIIVLDSVFKSIDFISESLPAFPENDTWFEPGTYQFIDKIIDIASKYFDMPGYIGYEMHKNTISLGYHHDKDEMLYATTGIFSFPLCSIVYYPHIQNLRGGELRFEDVTIKPITNRLVMFESSLPHLVAEHTGTRISIGINPWKEKPLAYRT